MPLDASNDSAAQAHQGLGDLIERLPQAKLIPTERRTWWIDGVLASVRYDRSLAVTDPANVDALERAKWHVLRMRGFGGSEVGSLVTSRRGGFPTFDTARDVVSGKYCMRLPEETDHTVRGHNAEDIIRDHFYKSFGHKSDDEAKAKFSSAMRQPLPDLPWRVGNPDDIVICPRGKRWIVDYKCPEDFVSFRADFESEGLPAPFDYICQLHHYRGIASHPAVGIPIEGLAIVAWNARRFEPSFFPVPFDPELEDELVQTGRFYWDSFVMKGKLPAPTERPMAHAPFRPNETMQRAGEVLALARAGQKFLRELEVRAQDEIKREIRAAGRLGRAPLNLVPVMPGDDRQSLLRASAKDEIDEEGMREALRRHGLNPTNFEKAAEHDPEAAMPLLQRMLEEISAAAASADPQAAAHLIRSLAAEKIPSKHGELDLNAAATALRAAGGDPALYVQETITLRTATGKGPGAQAVGRLQEIMGEHLGRELGRVRARLAGRDECAGSLDFRPPELPLDEENLSQAPRLG